MQALRSHYTAPCLKITSDDSICVSYSYYIKANENEQDDEDYLVDHTTVMYLVGPDGEFLDFFTSSVTAADIAKRIRGHMLKNDDADDSNGIAELIKIQLARIGKYFRGA